jgi:hypothetical protein
MPLRGIASAMGGEELGPSPPTCSIPHVGRPIRSDDALRIPAVPAQPPRRSVGGGGGGGGGGATRTGGGGGGGSSSQNAFESAHPSSPPATTPPPVAAAISPLISSPVSALFAMTAPPTAPTAAAPVAVKRAMQSGRFSRNVAHPDIATAITIATRDRILLTVTSSLWSAGRCASGGVATRVQASNLSTRWAWKFNPRSTASEPASRAEPRFRIVRRSAQTWHDHCRNHDQDRLHGSLEKLTCESITRRATSG